MSKRSREKRATTRGAYEPADNPDLDRAFALASGGNPPEEIPAYPFDDDEEDEGNG